MEICIKSVDISLCNLHSPSSKNCARDDESNVIHSTDQSNRERSDDSWSLPIFPNNLSLISQRQEAQQFNRRRRYLKVDVLRCLTMSLVVLVSHPGISQYWQSYSKALNFERTIYYQNHLRHILLRLGLRLWNAERGEHQKWHRWLDEMFQVCHTCRDTSIKCKREWLKKKSVYNERNLYMEGEIYLLDYFLLLFTSNMVFSHVLHTRSGVDQSRSGTGCLPGEHKSQTPSPHLRLDSQRENEGECSWRKRELPTSGAIEVWCYWMASDRHNRRDIHYLLANS